METQHCKSLLAIARQQATATHAASTQGSHYELNSIMPMSSRVALARYIKDNGDHFLKLFVLNGDSWFYTALTEAHVLGLAKLAPYLQQAEEHNLISRTHRGWLDVA